MPSHTLIKLGCSNFQSNRKKRQATHPEHLKKSGWDHTKRNLQRLFRSVRLFVVLFRFLQIFEQEQVPFTFHVPSHRVYANFVQKFAKNLNKTANKRTLREGLCKFRFV
jgi:hypothetical protein